jgi:probable F420-dependent oxidoreductase
LGVVNQELFSSTDKDRYLNRRYTKLYTHTRMKTGIVLPHMGPDVTSENIISLAKMAEQEKLDSLWVGERLLWPLKPQTPFPSTPDGNLPTIYQNVLDPIETLTFVAANTQKIALGTSVIDMLFHNPVVLARRFATLDLLTNGRAICGLGIGWSKDEYQVSNVPYENRGERANEFIEALKKIWIDDIVEYKGKYYNIPASKIGPKPVQKPHIPIYLGGFSPNTFSRIAKYANGWLGAAGGPLEYLASSIKMLRNQTIKANSNRNPSELEIAILVFPQIDTSLTKQNNNSKKTTLSGTIDEVGHDLQKIKEMGANHVIFGFTRMDSKQVIDSVRQLSRFLV